MSDLFVIIIAVVASAIVLLLFIRKWLTDAISKTKPSEEIVEWLKEVSKRVETSTQAVDTKLTENMKNFNTRLDKAAYVIAQVQKNIGEFSEIGRSMKQLQDFLASPKLRGGIGETILKDLLQELLPKPSFVLQYGFKNGHTVDAIIKTSQGLIAIDAKFPLENFRKISGDPSQKKDFVRDVKKHIQDISRKYILTAEGTLDYAIMYVPAESIYYEIINSEELYRFSADKRVLMVSPMSFYAYLKAILMSFEGQKIEQRAREILSLLQNLKKDYEKSDEALSVLNRHITNAYNQVSNVSKFFLSLGQKLETTRLIEQSEEVKKLS